MIQKKLSIALRFFLLFFCTPIIAEIAGTSGSAVVAESAGIELNAETARNGAISLLARFAGPEPALAAEKCENWLAKVVSVQGTVQARRDGETRWTEIKLDDLLCPGDMIRIRENSRAALMLRNEAIIRLDQNSALTLPGMEKERTIDLNFLSGAALIFSRFPFSLRVSTPFVNAGIEGTEFLVQVSAAETLLSVYEGKVHAFNQAGSLHLGRGQSASAAAGQPPTLSVVARPRDAVRWALYYPPIPNRDLEDLVPASAPWSAAFAQSLEAYRRGDLARAFALLKDVKPDPESAVFYAYRALLHLTVGRVDEAELDLRSAYAIDAQYSYVPALRSVIETVRNNKDAALDLAKKAVALDRSSPAALIALSYAQQARLDLDSALASTKKAAESDPRDGLARARLAELWLMKGYLDRALDAAREAVATEPGVSRTQTVLGYAYLTRVETGKSRKAFRKAIELDQADPLPRLGLGLALIREGNLKAGRTEIEIAAMLDPNNSLIRSYLGKAYYEEKDNEKASRELALAKELDPLDPTPWFYDAIRKDTINRPVEALEDLQKSMELNDNRAVYRSRLLLDQDLAARSASLGRIYNDLGFQQLAVVQGWKALNSDPSDFSAHRLLSDTYAFLPRHDTARISELLQAQLLQPINLNPIQPQLAETKFFMPIGLGPRDAAFNEFNALFNRNRIALLTSGVAGNHGTLGNEVVISGLRDKFSFSAGQFHYQTDGIRENNDFSHDIYNVFTQVSLSPKTSVQAELRHRNAESGELELLFDPTDIFGTRIKDNADSIRFGLHHAFAPGSDFISSFLYRQRDASETAIGSTDDLKMSGYGLEGQYLYRSRPFNFVAGAGYLDSNSKSTLVDAFGVSKTDISNPHANVYLYSTINFPENVSWVLGGSGDFLDLERFGRERSQFNPKVGVLWNPLKGTTIRAAAFRTLMRLGVSEEISRGQTIEPTQVAGFNQFFDDALGTDAWRYGIGIDQKISNSLYAGAEYSQRDMNVLGGRSGETVESNLKENLARAYLFWTPHKWFALGPEYQFEQFLNPREFLIHSFERIDTHRASLGINFFHPSGFLARLRPSYVFQEGDFVHFLVPGGGGPPVQTITKDSSSFFVLDASIGFLLPNRMGLFTVEARNLFDRSFRFQDSDPFDPEIVPSRSVVVRLTLSF